MTPLPRKLSFKASPLVLAVAMGLLGPTALLDEEGDSTAEDAPQATVAPEPSPSSSSLD